MRSACRGEGRKTSAPKRATSKRAAAMDIISMAQQARPKPSGQMELLRAQFTALSRLVKIMPSSWSRLPKSSGLVSLTCLPRDVLMVPRVFHFRTALWRIQMRGFSRTDVREANRDLETPRRKRFVYGGSVSSSGRQGPQIVFGSSDGTHGAHVIDHRPGPERGVLTRLRVLIPTAAATGLPHRPAHSVANVCGEMFLRFRAHFHHGDVAAAHQLEAIDDVIDLGFDHENHAIVPQTGVGSEENEEIWKAADGDAEISAHPIAPGVVNFDAAPAD